MKKVSNQEAKKTLFWGLAAFAGLMSYCLVYDTVAQILDYYRSWARTPEGWNVQNPALFWYIALRLSRIAAALPVGFCLSLGFRFKGLKSRFCVNWGWLALLAAAIVFCFVIFYAPLDRSPLDQERQFWFAPVSALAYSSISSLLVGLFMGHCLRAGLFAGEERIRGEK